MSALETDLPKQRALRIYSTPNYRGRFIQAGVIESKCALVKDQNYFRDKTWNNSYNFTRKIFKLYHEDNLKQNQRFSETQQKWASNTRANEEKARDLKTIHHRERSKSNYERIVMKRTDLQVQSGQALVDRNVSTIVRNNFTNFKDFPEKPLDYTEFANLNRIELPGQSCMLSLLNQRPGNTWNRLNQLSKKQLCNSITDSIIKMDERGFKAIKEKATKEKECQNICVNRKKLIYNKIRGENKQSFKDETANYQTGTSKETIGRPSHISREKKFDDSDCVGLLVNDVNRVKGCPENNFLNFVVAKSTFAQSLKQNTEVEHRDFQKRTLKRTSPSKENRPTQQNKPDEEGLAQLETFDQQVKIRRKFIYEARYPKTNLNQFQKFIF
jgi:hypothetical protein